MTNIFPSGGDDGDVFSAYGTKEVAFRFRGVNLRLTLSHGLFSSADIDSGSRLLLAAISSHLDEIQGSGRSLPRRILDAGSGVGVLGVALGAALHSEVPDGPLEIRASDRDELARVFSRCNAAAAGLEETQYRAYAEALGAALDEGPWDLILSNLPAKAGHSVLADFIARSTASLSPGGVAGVVIVNPLAAPCVAWLDEAGADIIGHLKGPEHEVFLFRHVGADVITPEVLDGRSLGQVYDRGGGQFEMESLRYALRAVEGVPDFDEPGLATVTAARLITKLWGSKGFSPIRGACQSALSPSVLIQGGHQGHLACWLSHKFASQGLPAPAFTVVDRNVLALASSVENLKLAATSNEGAAAGGGADAETPRYPQSLPAVDLAAIPGKLPDFAAPFDLVAAFRDPVPRVDRAAVEWEAARKLVGPGGVFLVSSSSTHADRFDRQKPTGFTRLGELKRDGFRACAYVLQA